MSNYPTPRPPAGSSPPDPDPLPLRWGVILMGALVASFIVGVLVFLQTGLWPAALLAALTGAGVVTRALHAILGPLSYSLDEDREVARRRSR